MADYVAIARRVLATWSESSNKSESEPTPGTFEKVGQHAGKQKPASYIPQYPAPLDLAPLPQDRDKGLQVLLDEGPTKRQAVEMDSVNAEAGAPMKPGVPAAVAAYPVQDELKSCADDYERRFGAPLARLFPYIGRRVSTPGGAGILLQVLSSRAMVDLAEGGEHGRHTARFFNPSDIQPIH